MSDKKQTEKIVNAPTDFSNPVCQDTFQSLPKIYGTIKNKVITNKINFYQNIKRKQRVNLMKSFNKNDLAEQTAKIISPVSKQKSSNKLNSQKKPLLKSEEIDIKNMVRFEDKYHKLNIKSMHKNSRIVTGNSAEDNESKHKIKFNTIKFLPTLLHHQSYGDEIGANLTDMTKEKVSRSISINNPLINLYRQDKPKIDNQASNNIAKRYNTSKNRKQISIKERIRTEKTSSVEESFDIRRSSLKTQFSRRLHGEKVTNNILTTNQSKFHVPSKQEYKAFIQAYQPINPAFNLKKLIKENNFQIISYPDGVYFGLTQLGLKVGEGVLVTENSIFEGIFQEDSKVKGSEQNIDGKYVGYFKNNQRQGKGRYEWINGEFFEGDWKQGKKNGYGVWQSPNGDSYVGNWLNGRQHGTGTHTHKNSVYKGEFAKSLKHGYGEQLFSNGDKFKGNYMYGKPEGKGKYEWVDGTYYEGEFKSGYRDGQGMLKQIDDSIYKGSFRRDFKHGFGQQLLKSGQAYEVQYNEGTLISKTQKKL